MLNIRMKRKELLIFSAVILALIGLNVFVMTNNNPLYSTDEELVNKDYVSSQKLFDDVWSQIKNNYYDSTLNHQTWQYWKDRYRGK